MDVNLESLTEDTRCNLDDTCTSINCCTQVSTLTRSFHTSFQLDHCNRVLSITIEKVTEKIVLTTLQLGKVYLCISVLK